MKTENDQVTKHTGQPLLTASKLEAFKHSVPQQLEHFFLKVKKEISAELLISIHQQHEKLR